MLTGGRYGATDMPLVRKTIVRGISNTVALELFPPRISIGYVVAPGAHGPPDGRQAVLDVQMTAASPASALRETIQRRVGVQRPMRIWLAPRRISEDSEAIRERIEDTLTVACDRVRGLAYALALTEDTREDGTSIGELDMGESEVHILVEEQTADGDWLVADLPPVAPPPPPQLGSAGGTDWLSQKAASTFGGPKPKQQIKPVTLLPPPTASTSKASTSITTRSQVSTSSTSRTPGLTGLSNLGNTCVRRRAH